MDHFLVKFIIPELTQGECEKQKRAISVRGHLLLLLVNCPHFHLIGLENLPPYCSIEHVAKAWMASITWT